MIIRYKTLLLFISLLLTFFLLNTSVSMAQEGHMKLLAVTEEGAGNGSIADLYLQIEEGKGRAYIDTYPLTKIDAQLSTRFAKDVACDFLEIDCSDKDFFYQINAGSLIIGGPSAGASLTVLTISLLDNVPVDETVAMTGTINSGGIIGSVGGLKQKIEVASQQGIRKVLIPKGKRNITEDNTSIDLVVFGEQLGIEVKEILTLEEAVFEFTGKNYTRQIKSVAVEESYAATMKALSEDLCKRTTELKNKLNSYVGNTFNNSEYYDAVNLTAKADEAFSNQNYYSSASFCFGANIKLDKLMLDQANITRKMQIDKLNVLLPSIHKSQNLTEAVELKTIQDLQTYVIVKERLDEAQEVLDNLVNSMNITFNNKIDHNDTDDNQSDDNQSDKNTSLENKSIELSVLGDQVVNQQLAYATERLYSAYSWSSFFGKPGKEFQLNKEATKISCEDKIAEAQVQLQYVKLLYPFDISGIEEGLNSASDELRNANFKRCLFKASKAKAEMNALLSSLGISEDQLNALVQVKFDLFSIVINKQMEKGIFPILGYSYYEYAKSLLDSDPASSLLYMEYALEMSNIDSYFEVNKKPKINFNEQGKKIFTKDQVRWLIIGLIIGFTAGFLVKRNKHKD